MGTFTPPSQGGGVRTTLAERTHEFTPPSQGGD